MGKQWKQWETLFSWAPKSLQMVTAAMKLKDACFLEEKLWQPRQILKNRDITLPAKVCLVKAMVFPVVMYGCESWTIKKAECWRIDDFELCVVLEKILENSLDCKEIKPVNPKGKWSWIFIERTEAEAESPILRPPDVKNGLIGKDSDARRDWRQEKGTTEDDMVGWYHQLDGQEFDQALGVGDGQGSLVCCNPWGHKESDTTEWLSNWTELNWTEGGLTPWELIPNKSVQGGVQQHLPSANGYPNQIFLSCKVKAQEEEKMFLMCTPERLTLQNWAHRLLTQKDSQNKWTGWTVYWIG